MVPAAAGIDAIIDVPAAAAAEPVPVTTRTFAGPDDIPPNSVSAYRIVAFPSAVAEATRDRFLAACQAFAATFVASVASAAPLDKQMITVWPVTAKDIATELNVADLTAHEGTAAPEDPAAKRKRQCAAAVDNYSLQAALQALYETGGAVKRATKAGPFLLAWAPGKQKGKVTAPVLVLDLSTANTEDEFARYFLKWRNDIQEKPDLWNNGWSWDLIRLRVGDFLDSTGNTLIAIVGMGQ